MSADDFDYEIFPWVWLARGDEHWRELMLDIGAPPAAEWDLAISASLERLREDLPYDLTETVWLQLRGAKAASLNFGETELSDSEIEVFSPVYTSRTRIFLFDDKPSSDELPPVSPMFPAIPFIEIKGHRIGTLSNPNKLASMSFRFESVPHEKRQEQFLRHLRWWEALRRLHSSEDTQKIQQEVERRSRGGANHNRTYLTKPEELKEYALKVEELRPHWKKIKKYFVKQDYDGGCVDSIKRLKWFTDLCDQWGGVPESVLRLILERQEERDRRKTWPYAFALEHARIIFDIKPLGFDMLDKLCEKGKALLKTETA